jgi:hypothetical protein
MDSTVTETNWYAVKFIQKHKDEQIPQSCDLNWKYIDNDEFCVFVVINCLGEYTKCQQ